MMFKDAANKSVELHELKKKKNHLNLSSYLLTQAWRPFSKTLLMINKLRSPP